MPPFSSPPKSPAAGRTVRAGHPQPGSPGPSSQEVPRPGGCPRPARKPLTPCLLTVSSCFSILAPLGKDAAHLLSPESEALLGDRAPAALWPPRSPPTQPFYSPKPSNPFSYPGCRSHFCFQKPGGELSKWAHGHTHTHPGAAGPAPAFPMGTQSAHSQARGE